MPVRDARNTLHVLIDIPCLGLASSLNIKQPWESYPVTFQVRSAKASNYPILSPTYRMQAFNEKKIGSINDPLSFGKPVLLTVNSI